ncbi:MAG: plasmid mobilization relaxosome protein MobC [Oscillospiraceae bacterium]|nr:plasmid mobilization relaxosome protein MobC [Oscillospiraceae bacterium]
MRKRNVLIQFWLYPKEANHFKKLVKKSGLNQSTYLRHLINGVVPQDAPPPDYYGMMNELRRIGNALDRAAQQAELHGLPNTAYYDNAVQRLDRAILDITDAVVMPRKL